MNKYQIEYTFDSAGIASNDMTLATLYAETAHEALAKLEAKTLSTITAYVIQLLGTHVETPEDAEAKKAKSVEEYQMFLDKLSQAGLKPTDSVLSDSMNPREDLFRVFFGGILDVRYEYESEIYIVHLSISQDGGSKIDSATTVVQDADSAVQTVLGYLEKYKEAHQRSVSKYETYIEHSQDILKKLETFQ